MTREDVVKGMNTWVGSHIDEFVKKNGMPDMEKTIMGKTVYIYDESQTVATPGSVGVYSSGVSATSYTTGSIINDNISTHTTANPGKPARWIGATKSRVTRIECYTLLTVNKSGEIILVDLKGC